MSQDEVFKIVQELGGKAASKDIRKRAKEKFPNATLYQYVTNRLHKLEKKGLVIKKIENDEVFWVIGEIPLK